MEIKQIETLLKKNTSEVNGNIVVNITKVAAELNKHVEKKINKGILDYKLTLERVKNIIIQAQELNKVKENYKKNPTGYLGRSGLDNIPENTPY